MARSHHCHCLILEQSDCLQENCYTSQQSLLILPLSWALPNSSPCFYIYRFAASAIPHEWIHTIHSICISSLSPHLMFSSCSIYLVYCFLLSSGPLWGICRYACPFGIWVDSQQSNWRQLYIVHFEQLQKLFSNVASKKKKKQNIKLYYSVSVGIYMLWHSRGGQGTAPHRQSCPTPIQNQAQASRTIQVLSVSSFAHWAISSAMLPPEVWTKPPETSYLFNMSLVL